MALEMDGYTIDTILSFISQVLCHVFSFVAKMKSYDHTAKEVQQET